MKKRYILTSLFAASLVAYAEINPNPRYDEMKPPTLPLPAAYERVMAALGAETNDYHCVAANIGTRFFRDGEWDFRFMRQTLTNTSPVMKLAAVSFDGKVLLNVSPIQ